MEFKGISVIIPAWGDLSIVHNSVLSAVRQWAPSGKYPKWEVIIVDDWIEGRAEDGSSPYEYYLSDEFKKFYDPDRVSINLIINSQHQYQGYSRQIGIENAHYEYFVLLDCDDVLAPNALYRYWETLNANWPTKQIAYLSGYVASFDKHYSNDIPGHSIWVQGRCYSSSFLHKYNISFASGEFSKKSEDLPFIRKIDFVVNTTKSWQIIEFDQTKVPPFVFWYPNEQSITRSTPHYAAHLSGWTLHSMLDYIDYWQTFANDYITDSDQAKEVDSLIKQEVLRCSIIAFYSLNSFIKTLKEDPSWILESGDWDILKESVINLRERALLFKSDVPVSKFIDIFYGVLHLSDTPVGDDSLIGDYFTFLQEAPKELYMTVDEVSPRESTPSVPTVAEVVNYLTTIE